MSTVLHWVSLDIENYRRDRDKVLQPSVLSEVVRQRRQVASTTDSSFYGFPSSYTFNLPFSCCTNGGIGTGPSVGGCENLSARNLCSTYSISSV